MRPSHALLDQIKRQRVRLGSVQPSTGFGERRSRLKGVGLEFAELRPFRDGDDLRHLDPRVSARTGERYIREFFFERRARVQILIDTQPSMRWRKGEKLALAKLVTNLIGFVGLISGDQVQVLHMAGTTMTRSPWFHGERSSERLFDYIEESVTDSASAQPLAGPLRPALRQRALLVLVSDFLREDAPDLLAIGGGMALDLLAVDIAHVEEIDPQIRPGAYNFSPFGDPEAEHAADIDGAMLAVYRSEYQSWKSTLDDAVRKTGGTRLALSVPDDGAAAQALVAALSVPVSTPRR